jgi:DNA-directed RNA polymerase beta subunit
MTYSHSAWNKIINPHCIPSRMTVGHLVECLLSKISSITATEGDATPFEYELTIDKLMHCLHETGYQKFGNEVLFNGHTGEKIDNQLFFGPTYYQRLKHMVDDKIHSRARGPLAMLTRQPVEGRGRDGGLRFGEMERDCNIAYGASMILKDRLLDESDKTSIFICERCGLLAYHDVKQRRYLCRVCGDKAKISSASVAYAFKLLLQEMQSLNIAPRLMVKERV